MIEMGAQLAFDVARHTAVVGGASLGQKRLEVSRDQPIKQSRLRSPLFVVPRRGVCGVPHGRVLANSVPATNLRSVGSIRDAVAAHVGFANVRLPELWDNSAQEWRLGCQVSLFQDPADPAFSCAPVVGRDIRENCAQIRTSALGPAYCQAIGLNSASNDFLSSWGLENNRAFLIGGIRTFTARLSITTLVKLRVRRVRTVHPTSLSDAPAARAT